MVERASLVFMRSANVVYLIFTTNKITYHVSMLEYTHLFSYTKFLEFQFVFAFIMLNEHHNVLTQPAFTCSKFTIETLEQDVKYVQS